MEDPPFLRFLVSTMLDLTYIKQKGSVIHWVPLFSNFQFTFVTWELEISHAGICT